MARVKIVLNRKGVKALLKSNEVRDDLDNRAERIAAAAGPGFEADSEVGPNRARASVRSVDMEAHIAEATDRTLTRALSAGK